MKAITDFLFRLKTYQVFTLFIITPLFNAIILILERSTSQQIIDYPIMPIYYTINMICNFFLLFYYYSIFKELKTEIPNNLKPKSHFFTLFLIINFIGYNLIQFATTIFFKNPMIDIENFSFLNASYSLEELFLIFASFFLIYVTTFISNIYITYFSGKTLSLVELKRDVSLVDYIAEIICLIFYPIGIWFVHPRIRKAYINKVEVNLKPNMVSNQ